MTNSLHNIFVTNYCCDMFQPQLLAMFRELKILSTFAAYVSKVINM